MNTAFSGLWRVVRTTLLLLYIAFFAFSALIAEPMVSNQNARAQATCAPLDVVLAIDSTSSMGGAIANVKAESTQLVNQIVEASGGDYQLGLVEFRDDITVLTDMAPGTASIINLQIGRIQASGGGPIPEASDETLNTIVNRLSAAGRPQSGDFNGVWRPDAEKIIILITDAPPGGFDDTYTEGIDNVNAAQRAAEAAVQGIRISAVYVPTREDVVAAGANAVNDLYADIAEAIMYMYKDVTNGAFIKTAKDGSGTANAIALTIAECGEIPDPVVGDPEVPGASEPVQVPEPITIVLFGAGVAGIAGYARSRRAR